MKKTVGGCVVVGACVIAGPVWALGTSPPTASAPAEADPASESETPELPARSPYAPRFELGARTGYGLVFGKADASATSPIKRISPGQIPFWFDLGARLGGHFFVGAYVSYGFGILSGAASDACQADQDAANGLDVSCHVQDVRLGAEFLYHPLVGTDFDPWVGLSSGWEWFSFDETASLGDQSASVGVGTDGPEYVTAQAGFDYWMSRTVTAGLFVAFSVSSDIRASTSCDAPDCSAADSASVAIHDKTIHDWLFLGGRMSFSP